jgi:prolyl-tRNA synthetase
MKDAYSFDVGREEALATYKKMYAAYQAIFDRLGLAYRVVEADAGNIGGSQTHEFQVLAEAGEDALMVCEAAACDFAANVEVAPAIAANPAEPAASDHVPAETAAEKPMEPFPTPGRKTIASLAEFLGVGESALAKTMFFAAEEGAVAADIAIAGSASGAAIAAGDRAALGGPIKAVAVLLRGCDEVNPVKLKNALGLANPPRLLTEDEVRAATGASPGSCGPVGLRIPILLDAALEGRGGLVVGANRDDEHLRNVVPGRDFRPAQVADIRLAREGDLCPRCRTGHYKAARGIEVGHVFYLGAKYSKAMGATFLNAEGLATPIEMGCYGIGISRAVQAAIEQSHDQDGIAWPPAIAPFAAHIVVLDPENEEVATASAIICRELESRSVDVFVDDRQERPGVKFKDADLLGMPLRINIGARGLQSGEVELVRRKDRRVTRAPVEAASEAAIECLRAIGWRPSL